MKSSNSSCYLVPGVETRKVPAGLVTRTRPSIDESILRLLWLMQADTAKVVTTRERVRQIVGRSCDAHRQCEGIASRELKDRRSTQVLEVTTSAG